MEGTISKGLMPRKMLTFSILMQRELGQGWTCLVIDFNILGRKQGFLDPVKNLCSFMEAYGFWMITRPLAMGVPIALKI